MNVSQTAEYALRAVICMVQHPETQTTQQIAEYTGMPKSYLPKVLQPLARAGLISAQRGVKGGYHLLKESQEISVLDVVRCVDPAKTRSRCPGTFESGPARCPLHRLLEGAEQSAEQLFAQTTIHKLAFEQDGQPVECGPAAAAEATEVPSPSAKFIQDNSVGSLGA